MGRSAARMVDDTTTHFTLAPNLSQKSCLARTFRLFRSGAENLGSATILRRNLSSALHTSEMRKSCDTGMRLSCIVDDVGDQSRVGALIAASNLVSQITSIKRTYRDSR